MKNNVNFVNFVFYGKEIHNLNRLEMELLMNDFLMFSTIHLLTSETTKNNVNKEIEQTYKMCLETRSNIMSELLDMKNTPKLLVLISSESSKYSFTGFTEKLIGYLNDENFTKVTKVLGMELNMN